jgi:hypothetical protein
LRIFNTKPCKPLDGPPWALNTDADSCHIIRISSAEQRPLCQKTSFFLGISAFFYRNPCMDAPLPYVSLQLSLCTLPQFASAVQRLFALGIQLDEVGQPSA